MGQTAANRAPVPDLDSGNLRHGFMDQGGQVFDERITFHLAVAHHRTNFDTSAAISLDHGQVRGYC